MIDELTVCSVFYAATLKTKKVFMKYARLEFKKFVFFAVISICWTLNAQTLVSADKPKYSIGDSFKSEVSSNYTGQKQLPDEGIVTAVNAETIEFSVNGIKSITNLELNPIETSTSIFTGEAKFYSFPLTVGKQWSSKYSFTNKNTGAKGRQQFEARIVAVEKIKVPAGEFEAFKIEYKGFWNNDSSGRNGRLLQTNWYAPAVKRAVRVDYDDGFNRNTRELTEYKVN